MPFKQTQRLQIGNEFVLNRLHSPDMHTTASETVSRIFFLKKTKMKKKAILKRLLSTGKRRFQIFPDERLEWNDVSVDIV